MRIGILETGTPPAGLETAHGCYVAMTRDLVGPGHEIRAYRVFDDVLPVSVGEADAYIVTGSAAGVGDALPWIAPLVAFLRAARGQARLVGICFGHQVMAHAFGGTVHKAPQGWGLGLHRYAVTPHATDWASGGAIGVIVSHQDQVVTAPPDAQVLAGSAFTPNGVLAYDDGMAISCQCHPEFTPRFAHDLIAGHCAPDVSDAERDAALASLAHAADDRMLKRWIREFLA